MTIYKSTVYPVSRRVKNFQEIATGVNKKNMVDEAIRCLQCHGAPCLPACPIGVDIPGFIRLLRESDPHGALAKIREENDLPAICGRVCMAPCERSCVYEPKKSEIGIRALERFAADHGALRLPGRKAIVPTGKKVAVIGSGPAGLVAAARLAKAGLKVTVLEALPLLGGALRYGIPEFRLPKNVLDAQIEEIRFLGVEFKINFPLGQSVRIEQLLKEGYSAVLLTVGKSSPQYANLPGEDLGGVYYAKEILMPANFRYESRYKKDPQPPLGQKVVVIGEGNAALDCARICVRLLRETKWIFPVTIEDLKVYPADQELGQEEGVICEPMTKPLEIIADEKGFVRGVKCLRMDFAGTEGKERWQLKPVPGTEFIIEAQSVILAPKFKTNKTALGSLSGLKLKEDGSIWTDPNTAMTSLPRIYAAGDAASTATIVEAMAAAKTAAQSITQMLKSTP